MVGRLGDEATILGGGEMAQRTRRGCVFPAQSGREWFAEKVPKKRGWREICWSVIMPTWEALERGLLLFRGEGCIFFLTFYFVLEYKQLTMLCRRPHNFEQSSLCYTVSPCWLYILNIVMRTCPFQTPSLFLRPILLLAPETVSPLEEGCVLLTFY